MELNGCYKVLSLQRLQLRTSTSVSGTATVNLVTNTPNPDGITIGEVRTATNEALDTNENLVNTEHAVAYLVSDGATGGAAVAAGRLLGIRPKAADFDANETYDHVFDE